MKKLISTRRIVEPERMREYEVAWSRLVEVARGSGIQLNSWRFRSGRDPRIFIEFLEFHANADPRHATEIAERLRALEGIARGDAEAWDDANDLLTIESDDRP